MAFNENLGVNLCCFSGSSVYVAADCLLFSSTTTPIIISISESFFDLVLFCCLVSGFRYSQCGCFFAGMGLSATGFFVVRKFSGTSWDNVCLGGEGDVGDSILTLGQT